MLAGKAVRGRVARAHHSGGPVAVPVTAAAVVVIRARHLPKVAPPAHQREASAAGAILAIDVAAATKVNAVAGKRKRVPAAGQACPSATGARAIHPTLVKTALVCLWRRWPTANGPNWPASALFPCLCRAVAVRAAAHPGPVSTRPRGRDGRAGDAVLFRHGAIQRDPHARRLAGM